MRAIIIPIALLLTITLSGCNRITGVYETGIPKSELLACQIDPSPDRWGGFCASPAIR